MKLTIKNHDKCIGWAFHGPRKDLTWKIKSVYEKDDVYEFDISLEDDLGNRVTSDNINLSREEWKDSDGEVAYRFMPHGRQCVTPEWFANPGNAYTAFESEINRINQNY